jgi:hypothetical protein
MSSLDDPGVNKVQLRALYKNDPIAKQLFDDLASRTNNYREQKVDRTANRLHVDQASVREVFKRLQLAGCGRLIPGRRGHVTRFEWYLGMVEVGKYAAQQASNLPVVEPTEPEPEIEADSVAASGDFTHSFQLRADRVVSITLPADFTSAEAARLGTWLSTLPLG